MSKKVEFFYDLCQAYQTSDFISPGSDVENPSKVTQASDGLTVLSTKNDQFMWFQAYRKPFKISSERKTCFVIKMASKQYDNDCTSSGMILIDPDNCYYYGFLMNEKDIKAVYGQLPDPIFDSKKEDKVNTKHDKHYTSWKMECELPEYIKYKSYIDWCEYCIKYNKSACDWKQWDKWLQCYLESSETASFYTIFSKWKSELTDEDYKTWKDWKEWSKKKKDHSSSEKGTKYSGSNCVSVMKKRLAGWYQLAICFEPEQREILWYVDGKLVYELDRSPKEIARKLGRRFKDKFFPNHVYFGMGNFAWNFGCTDCPCPDKLGSCIKVEYLKVVLLPIDDSSSSSSNLPSDSRSWISVSPSSSEDDSSSGSSSSEDCGTWSYTSESSYTDSDSSSVDDHTTSHERDTKPSKPSIRYEGSQELIRSARGVKIYRNGSFRPN